MRGVCKNVGETRILAVCWDLVGMKRGCTCSCEDASIGVVDGVVSAIPSSSPLASAPASAPVLVFVSLMITFGSCPVVSCLDAFALA
jgi:hypothetical protein